jgi:hypothetical protein
VAMPGVPQGVLAIGWPRLVLPFSSLLIWQQRCGSLGSFASLNLAQNQRALIIPLGKPGLPSPPPPCRGQAKKCNKLYHKTSSIHQLPSEDRLTRRGALCREVIKRGTDEFKLIGSAVTCGPWERLGVLTTQGGKIQAGDTVIDSELSSS